MNYQIKEYIWIAAAAAVVIVLAMFIIPVLSALLLGFFGICVLLAASRWIAGIFNKNESSDDKFDTNYEEQGEPDSHSGRSGRLIKMKQQVVDAEIIKEEKDR